MAATDSWSGAPCDQLLSRIVPRGRMGFFVRTVRGGVVREEIEGPLNTKVHLVGSMQGFTNTWRLKINLEPQKMELPPKRFIPSIRADRLRAIYRQEKYVNTYLKDLVEAYQGRKKIRVRASRPDADWSLQNGDDPWTLELAIEGSPTRVRDFVEAFMIPFTQLRLWEFNEPSMDEGLYLTLNEEHEAYLQGEVNAEAGENPQ